MASSVDQTSISLWFYFSYKLKKFSRYFIMIFCIIICIWMCPVFLKSIYFMRFSSVPSNFKYWTSITSFHPYMHPIKQVQLLLWSLFYKRGSRDTEWFSNLTQITIMVLGTEEFELRNWFLSLFLKYNLYLGILVKIV